MTHDPTNSLAGKDGLARRLRALPVLLLPALLLPGCEPSSTSTSVSLQSGLFSEIQVIGTRGTALGQFNKPRSLALDSQDNLYVVDLSGRVQKFSPAGAFLLSWRMEETDLGKPKGMARDAEGNIIVIEPHYSRINHFTPEGRLASQWGSPGTNTGQFTVPRAAAIQTNGDILVCEYSKIDRVQVFRGRDKSLLFAFGQPGAGPGEFSRPEGLATDREGRIYVADSCNHRIQVFSAQGVWLASFGRPGTGPGQLSYPYDILVDDAGRLYVCEFGNSRIQIFDSHYQSLEIIGGIGFEPGRFHNPWSIALDSRGNLYVADGANHRVQKLVSRGSASAAPGRGNKAGRSLQPTDARLTAALSRYSLSGHRQDAFKPVSFCPFRGFRITIGRNPRFLRRFWKPRMNANER